MPSFPPKHFGQFAKWKFYSQTLLQIIHWAHMESILHVGGVAYNLF